MSLDKLVDSEQLDADLTSVANAIRTKGGASGTLSFPSGMVTAISNIPGSYNIVVTTETGNTVTATKGSTTVSGTASSGVCTLTVHDTGSWLITVSNGTDTASESVTVTNSFGASIILNCVLHVTGTGSTSTSSTYCSSYIMVNGTQYTSSATITLGKGTSVDVYGKGGTSGGRTFKVIVKLNGTSVGSGSSGTSAYSKIYTYTMTEDASLALVYVKASNITTDQYVEITTS